ncbi:protein YAE1 homolog isoform X2 [Strix uralensis]|uniref:protein YAE1 homolog isoform X2 n=1 Tax=Strix uralensis TaxID=36305 RepID=UPI003DA1F661
MKAPCPGEHVPPRGSPEGAVDGLGQPHTPRSGKPGEGFTVTVPSPSSDWHPSAGRRVRPPRPASLSTLRGCAHTQDGRPPPVSQADFEATGLLVKMAAVYLRPRRSLPSANMADAPLLLPTAVKPVCPQSRWRRPASGGAWWRGGCELIIITTVMSWVQVAVSRSSEDIFDEDVDEMYLLQKEWNSTMKKRLKEGYRDGIEAGKELALQEGFNQGYRHGAELMVTCGQFRGTLNALLSWCHSNGRDSALSKINNLLDVVGKHEENVLKYLNSTDQQPHLGYILDSVQDMDLNDTAPAGTVYSEVKAGKHEDVDSSGGNVYGNNVSDSGMIPVMKPALPPCIFLP